MKQIEEGGVESARIEAIEPPKNSKLVKSYEKNRAKLVQGAKDGFSAVIEKFNKYHLRKNPDISILE